MCRATTVADDRSQFLAGVSPLAPRTKASGTFKSAMSIISGKGSYEVRNSENDVDRAERLGMITQFLFCYRSGSVDRTFMR